jgi:hypothetical protein
MTEKEREEIGSGCVILCSLCGFSFLLGVVAVYAIMRWIG